MKLSEPTPGPWCLLHRSIISGTTGQPVSGLVPSRMRNGDYHLVLEAPNLLDAGKAVLAAWEKGDLAAAVRALAGAVARAEGA